MNDYSTLSKAFWMAILWCPAIYASSLDNFKNEVDRISNAFECKREGILPPLYKEQGKLFSCIGGDEETIKIFINSKPNGNDVKNVKFMWNEWKEDIGHSVSSDYLMAKRWLADFSKIYFPNKSSEINKAFFKKKNFETSTDDIVIKYSIQRGNKIDEHLISITSMIDQNIENKKINSSIDKFSLCKEIISSSIGYSSSFLSGNGNPINHDRYDSFLLEGKKRDLFFCEIYEDGTYKLKASLNGNFPFKYISHGNI